MDYAHQAPLSLDSLAGILEGLLCPLPGDLPDPRIESASLRCPALAVGSLPLVPPGKCHLSHSYPLANWAWASMGRGWIPNRRPPILTRGLSKGEKVQLHQAARAPDQHQPRSPSSPEGPWSRMAGGTMSGHQSFPLCLKIGQNFPCNTGYAVSTMTLGGASFWHIVFIRNPILLFSISSGKLSLATLNDQLEAKPKVSSPQKVIIGSSDGWRRD